MEDGGWGALLQKRPNQAQSKRGRDNFAKIVRILKFLVKAFDIN